MLLPFAFPLSLFVFITSVVAFLVTFARHIIHPLSDPYGAVAFASASLRILFA